MFGGSAKARLGVSLRYSKAAVQRIGSLLPKDRQPTKILNVLISIFNESQQKSRLIKPVPMGWPGSKAPPGTPKNDSVPSSEIDYSSIFASIFVTT